MERMSDNCLETGSERDVITCCQNKRRGSKIDKQLINAGWDIVSRDEYVRSASAVKGALMVQGNNESDYLLFVDDKAIAVVEAKRADNPLGEDVEPRAEGYSSIRKAWYGLWFPNQIPLVYMANGKIIYFKNLLTESDGEYIETFRYALSERCLQSDRTGIRMYGALPRLDKRGLQAIVSMVRRWNLEQSHLKMVRRKESCCSRDQVRKDLSGLSCRLLHFLNYTPQSGFCSLVDRNNLARQTGSEFSTV